MQNNVFNIASNSQLISPDDQGIYYAVNRKTGEINNVFQLLFESQTNSEHESGIDENKNWYLYQLKNTGKNGEMGWVILADNGDYPLIQVSSDEIKHHFNKPEYVEPKGTWQLMRNSRYGIGKFTPLHADENIRFAFILFSGKEMLVPLLILKADENSSLQCIVEPKQ